MSTHSVKILDIESVQEHPNAERLEIVPVGGWQAVVRKGDFKAGDRAVYIEPDYVVPTDRAEFAFLKKEGRTTHRLKAVRLRGELSFGLIIPVPKECAHITDGVAMMETLGVTRYEPPVKYLTANELPHEDHPQIYCPKFDVEAQKNFEWLIRKDEFVHITEKIHGANARYLWTNDRFYIGSRNRWIDPTTDSVWKAAADACPAIIEWCKGRPGVVLFGEVYGRVQSLTYGVPNAVHFAGFAALDRDTWYNQGVLFRSLRFESVPHVPILYSGAFDPELAAKLAEEDSSVPTAPAGHMREGVVIVPFTERPGPSAGRCATKLISNRYWESNEE